MAEKSKITSEKDKAYRRRLAAEGQHQLVVALPRETVAFIDDVRRQFGLHNRSAALLKLLEEGRPVAQQ